MVSARALVLAAAAATASVVRGAALAPARRGCVVPPVNVDVRNEIYTVAIHMHVDLTVMIAMMATAIRESNVNNLDCGDKDSLGVFQQRPSQAWGTPEQLQNVTYATIAYLNVAIKLDAQNPGMDPGDLAQMVQDAEAGNHYTENEGTAKQYIALAAAATGLKPPTNLLPNGSGKPVSLPTPTASEEGVPVPSTVTAPAGSIPSIVPSDGGAALPPVTVTQFGAGGAAPALAGLIADCSLAYTPVPGDTCLSVANAFDISLEEFYAWNAGSGLDEVQCLNLQVTQAYCVSTDPTLGAGPGADGPITETLTPNATAGAGPPLGTGAPGLGSGKQGTCFPSAGFKRPKGTPNATLDEWWCDEDAEYAFMGFSHAINDCPSASTLAADFKDMADNYGARYVRLYAACDRDGFLDDVVQAAYDAGMGVVALDWFGFTGGNAWQGRLASIISTVQSNPLAPYVVRHVTVGSESLFDHDLPGAQLAQAIADTQLKLKDFGTRVTTSDFAYIWQQNGDVVSVADEFMSSTLPFFGGNATSGGAAWGAVESDLKTFQNLDKSKKILLDECGWPSNTDVWQANSKSAVASVSSEQAFYDMLDAHCADFKAARAGWFAHVYDDAGLPGWGVTSGGQPKFDFSPRTAC